MTSLLWLGLALFAVYAAAEGLPDVPPLVVGGAIGALVTWLLNETSRRSAEESAKAERRRRTISALRAEIDLSAETLRLNFDPREAAERRARYAAQVIEAGPNEHSMPMAETYSDYYIFDHQRPNLADLPEYAIREIVRFYQSDRYVTELLEGFAEGHYEKTSVLRRLKAIDMFFTLGFSALEAAIKARCALDAAARGEASFDPDSRKDCSPEERTLLGLLGEPRTFEPSPEALVGRTAVRPEA